MQVWIVHPEILINLFTFRVHQDFTKLSLHILYKIRLLNNPVGSISSNSIDYYFLWHEIQVFDCMHVKINKIIVCIVIRI